MQTLLLQHSFNLCHPPLNEKREAVQSPHRQNTTNFKVEGWSPVAHNTDTHNLPVSFCSKPCHALSKVNSCHWIFMAFALCWFWIFIRCNCGRIASCFLFKENILQCTYYGYVLHNGPQSVFLSAWFEFKLNYQVNWLKLFRKCHHWFWIMSCVTLYAFALKWFSPVFDIWLNWPVFNLECGTSSRLSSCYSQMQIDSCFYLTSSPLFAVFFQTPLFQSAHMQTQP